MENLSPLILWLLWNISIAVLIILSISFLSFFRKSIEKNLNHLIAITTWMILSIVFMWFFPTISHELENFYIYVLLWIMLFYLLEITIHFHHCHDLEEENKSCKHFHSKHTTLMFTWTFFHNFFHWVILVSWFAASLEAWIALTIAIALHALPQNISNFIMNHKNWNFVILAGVWWIFWALVLFIPYIWDFVLENKFIILGVTAGWLIHLALSDIIPSMNKDSTHKEKIIFFWLVVFWIALNLFFQEMTGGDHDHWESHETEYIEHE